MRKLFWLYILFASIEASGQKDTGQIKFLEPSDSTGFGTPDGKPTNKSIGAAGGTITSDDGRVQLIFPPGALTAATDISIQPTTNLAPNGAGKAYQFEPSGIQFKKPVQIILHYTNEEAENCPPDLMGLAMQDHTGKWSFIDYDDWDSTGKMLKGYIQHFSGASNVYMLELRATHSSLRVGEGTPLSILELTPKFKNKRGKAKSTYIMGKLELDKRFEWKVNEVPNGDEIVGQVFSGDIRINTKTNPSTYYPMFEYDAPKKALPDENPVTVKATLGTYDADNYFRPKVTLSCKIEIYDEYKVIIKDTIEARVGMGTFVADSATFLIKMTKRGIFIEDVKNYPPYSFKLFDPPKPFKLTVDVGPPCLGTVHIGARTIQLFKNKPPEAPDVLMTFATPEILAFKFTIGARGTSTDAVSKLSESIPNLISFRPNGEAQTIRVRTRALAPYNIYIIPIRAH